MLASALVLIQQTDATCPKGAEFRALYAKIITDKHEDSITKFGAILAQGGLFGNNATAILTAASF